ncbi:MAG: aspartate aminotransferase family protein [Solirubrobacterales bacterium]
MSKGDIMNTYGRFDVVFEKGRGCRLYDDKGTEYMDMVSGVAVNCLGHNHPVIVNAIKDQLENVMHISNYYYNSRGIELSERLCLEGHHEAVFFCNSGTEAMEAGIKIGRKYGKLKGGDKKNIIIHMENSFHGRTIGALSVTGQPKYQKDFMPLMGGVESVKINDLKEILHKMNDDVCAVIIEPIQGEGGINSATIEYLRFVHELCNQFDALLIFDEIQCGIGRTGEFYAYKKFGVVPDVVCVAKGLGGGFPIGAVIANKRANVLVPGDHGSTFGGNPLACAVGLAVFQELVDNGVISKIDEKSQYFKNKLGELQKKYPVIKEVKGMGLLLGIALSVDVKEFSKKCFENKLLAVTAGEDVIRILPPLNVEYDEIDEAISLLEKVLKTY